MLLFRRLASSRQATTSLELETIEFGLPKSQFRAEDIIASGRWATSAHRRRPHRPPVPRSAPLLGRRRRQDDEPLSIGSKLAPAARQIWIEKFQSGHWRRIIICGGRLELGASRSEPAGKHLLELEAEASTRRLVSTFWRPSRLRPPEDHKSRYELKVKELNLLFASTAAHLVVGPIGFDWPRAEPSDRATEPPVAAAPVSKQRAADVVSNLNGLQVDSLTSGRSAFGAF